MDEYLICSASFHATCSIETPDLITNRYACKKLLIKLFRLLLLFVAFFLSSPPLPSPPFHHSRRSLPLFTTIDPNHILSLCKDLQHHSQVLSQAIEPFRNKYFVCIMADRSHYSGRPPIHPYHDGKGIIEARTIRPGMKIVSNATDGPLYM